MNGTETKHLLRNRNIRATAKKVAILRAIIESGRPVNADELHARVSEVIPLDLATVYRTLAVFHKSGLIREISDPTGVLYVEAAMSGYPVHPHFRCLKCMKLYCLRECSCDEAVSVRQVDEGFDVQEISVTLSGICKQCNRREP
ncbi:transcriptional repressor [bacterium]|nr:transcriptional repressor [bacterium]